ncbi:MAG: hypothetical protein LIP09_13080 [Bacteroidales bacterium]|nr:hypothetical protein [Bacteroidales bacterium]
MEIINRPIYLDHITSLLNRGMMLVLAYIPSITMFLPANFSALALMYWHMELEVAVLDIAVGRPEQRHRARF